MRFVPQKKGRLKVILSPQDMDSFGVTYSQMDYSDLKTRRILAGVLESARRQTGFCCPESSRLLIELFPVLKGGCVIVFTVLEPAGGGCFEQGPEEIFVFAFPRLEPLGQAARTLAEKPFPKGCRCALYRLGEEYRIVCHSPSATRPGTPAAGSFSGTGGVQEPGSWRRRTVRSTEHCWPPRTRCKSWRSAGNSGLWITAAPYTGNGAYRVPCRSSLFSYPRRRAMATA